MEHQIKSWGILNWRILRGPEIGTDHTPIMFTLSTNQIKIKTAARDNYTLADWQLLQIHISKWENVELNRKRTQEIRQTTRKLIHLTEAKTRAVSQTKYKTLPHPEDTPEMINIREEVQQLNQQIEVMG